MCWAVAAAQEDDPATPLADYLAELADPATENWEQVENRIIDLWSRSGSRSIDLLLQRGRDALEAEDFQAALEHFSALTDHAPDFAEGWNMRGTAFFMLDEQMLSVEDLVRALAINPDHFGALNGLGVILENFGDHVAALEAYRRAFAVNPHRQNVAEAIERLEKIVEGVDI